MKTFFNNYKNLMSFLFQQKFANPEANSNNTETNDSVGETNEDKFKKDFSNKHNEFFNEIEKKSDPKLSFAENIIYVFFLNQVPKKWNEDNEKIKALQIALKKLGNTSLKTNGMFSKNTVDAYIIARTKVMEKIYVSKSSEKAVVELKKTTDVKPTKNNANEIIEPDKRLNKFIQDYETSFTSLKKLERTLKKGVSGKDVIGLKKFLNFKLGSELNTESALFDENTEKILKKYQSGLYSNPDGEITYAKGKEYSTMRKIKKDINSFSREDYKKQFDLEGGEYNQNTEVEKKQTVPQTKNHPNYAPPSVGNRPTVIEKSVETSIKPAMLIKYTRNEDIVSILGDIDKESLKNINLDSLNELVRKGNLKDIINSLKETLNLSDLSEVDIKLGNYSILDILKGYQPDGSFGPYEADTLVKVLNLYNKAQEKITQLDTENKIRALIDFDGNGILMSKQEKFYVGEAQLNYNIFHRVGSDGMESLITNLFPSETLESFSKKIDENFFSAKEMFIRELASRLNMGIAITELTTTGGFEKAIDKIYENKDKIIQEISKEINKQTKEKWSNIDFGEFDFNTLSLSAVSAMIGENPGLLLKFNAKNSVKSFLNSIEIGFIEGLPYISISKEKIEKEGLTASWIKEYLVIPAYKSTQKLNDVKLEDIKNAFPKNIKAGAGYELEAKFSIIAPSLFFNIYEINEDTSRGIESMKNKMKNTLEEVAEDIKAGKNFESSKFYDEIDDKHEASQIYNNMMDSYNVYAKGKDYEGEFLDYMIDGYLKHYENKLYSNAEGLHINSVGIGATHALLIGLLTGFNLVPYLRIGGESISTDFSRRSTSMGEDWREMDISRTKEKIDVVTYEDKKVLLVKGGAKYGISDFNGTTQAKIVGEDLYLSGNLSKLSIREHNTDKGYFRTIIIGGGQLTEKYGKNVYVFTKITNEIINSVQGVFGKDQEIDSFDEKILLEIDPVVSFISDVVKKESLNAQETVGMQKLQRMIFDYKKTGEDLDSVWEQFLSVVNNKGFEEYAISVKDKFGHRPSKQDRLDLVKNQINTVSDDNEKALIIQSVTMGLMRRNDLVYTGFKDKKISTTFSGSEGMSRNERGYRFRTVPERNGKPVSIAEYDGETRPDFFQKEFVLKYPDLADRIKEAREERYNLNGNFTKFDVRVVSGGFAFVGVQSKKANGDDNIRGVMPLTGYYNIASFGKNTDYVNIPGKSENLINSIPERVLENLKNTLNENGATLKNIDQVKTFINNGGNGDIKIDYQLAFAKMGECLNEAVVLRNLSITRAGEEKPIIINHTSNSYIQENNVKDISVNISIETIGNLFRPGSDGIPTEGGSAGVENGGVSIGTGGPSN